MVLVDEIDIWSKRNAKRQRDRQKLKVIKQLGLTKGTDKKIAEAKMKMVYRDRLKRFLKLTAKISDKRVIKIFSKHLREIETIFYERDEYKSDREKNRNINDKDDILDTPDFKGNNKISLDNKDYVPSPVKSSFDKRSESVQESPSKISFGHDIESLDVKDFKKPPLPKLKITKMSDENQDNNQILKDLNNENLSNSDTFVKESYQRN